MSNRRRGPREARTVAVVAVVLTLLSVGLSLAVGPRTEHTDGTLRLFDGPAVIRVRLDRIGKSPWLVDAIESELIVETPETRFDDVGSLRVSNQGDLIRLDNDLIAPQIILRSAEGIAIDGRQYRGTLHVNGGGAAPVLHIELEAYIEGVVGAEMPLSWPISALKAQAIASRSYAIRSMTRRRSREWDVRDGEMSQVFRPVVTPRAREVVASTRGQVLAYGDRPLPAYFSATCGGARRSSQDAFGGEAWPPLAAGDCGACDHAPEHTWTKRVPLSVLAKAAGLDKVEAIAVASPSGHGTIFEVVGNGTKKRLAARDISKHLPARGLLSTFVESATIDGRDAVLLGHGFGHGVGLCQNGARGLAEAGFTTREILDFYYRGADLLQLVPRS